MISFYSKSPDYSWLSNFSEHGFALDGVHWASVEHFYQAQKYSETEAADRIRKADSPAKARKAGQARSLVPRPDWDRVKEEMMRQAIRAKFGQNRRLREQLLATADEDLVHASADDLFWGRSQEGVGDNRLGVIIMEIRSELRAPAKPNAPKKSGNAH